MVGGRRPPELASGALERCARARACACANRRCSGNRIIGVVITEARTCPLGRDFSHQRNTMTHAARARARAPHSGRVRTRAKRVRARSLTPGKYCARRTQRESPSAHSGARLARKRGRARARMRMEMSSIASGLIVGGAMRCSGTSPGPAERGGAARRGERAAESTQSSWTRRSANADSQAGGTRGCPRAAALTALAPDVPGKLAELPQ